MQEEGEDADAARAADERGRREGLLPTGPRSMPKQKQKKRSKPKSKLPGGRKPRQRASTTSSWPTIVKRPRLRTRKNTFNDYVCERLRFEETERRLPAAVTSGMSTEPPSAVYICCICEWRNWSAVEGNQVTFL